MVDYYIFTTDYVHFKFKDVYDEIKANNGIIWHNGSIENGKYAHTYKKDDIVYVYFFILFYVNGKILMKFKIVNSDVELTPYIAKNGSLVKVVKLEYISGIDIDRADDFSLSNLKSKYHVKEFQGNPRLNSDKYIKLINDLNIAFKKSKLTDIGKFMECYNSLSVCYFDGKENNYSHDTFVEENGLNYYEVHHLIEKNILNKYPEMKDIVEDKNNKFNLCPNCHRRIHYGVLCTRKQLVNELYLHNQDFFDKKLKNVVTDSNIVCNTTDDNAVLKWLLQQYGVK